MRVLVTFSSVFMLPLASTSRRAGAGRCRASEKWASLGGRASSKILSSSARKSVTGRPLPSTAVAESTRGSALVEKRGTCPQDAAGSAASKARARKPFLDHTISLMERGSIPDRSRCCTVTRVMRSGISGGSATLLEGDEEIDAGLGRRGQVGEEDGDVVAAVVAGPQPHHPARYLERPPRSREAQGQRHLAPEGGRPLARHEGGVAAEILQDPGEGVGAARHAHGHVHRKAGALTAFGLAHSTFTTMRATSSVGTASSPMNRSTSSRILSPKRAAGRRPRPSHRTPPP